MHCNGTTVGDEGFFQGFFARTELDRGAGLRLHESISPARFPV